MSLIDGASVLVIDDVMTTGATVRECARTLKRHGAARVTVAAIARAVLPTRVD
ncbi:MAG: phosphoribosyltransferase family protein [Pseudomonadota bacterium]